MIRLVLPLLLLAPLASAQADVQAAAEAAVAEVWADAEVRVVRLSGGAEDAHPPIRVHIRDDAPRGRVSAEVESASGSTWEPAGWAYLDVAVYDTVAVLTHDVARGEPVADAIRWERTDVSDLRDVLPKPDAAPEWTARRTLRAGTVLTSRLAEAPAAADSGDPIRVRYARGAVAVVLDCEARERGAVGDTIRATCSDPRATYRVRLTAPGEGDWAATL